MADWSIDLPEGWYNLRGDGIALGGNKRISIIDAGFRYEYHVYVADGTIKGITTIGGTHPYFDRLAKAEAIWGEKIIDLLIIPDELRKDVDDWPDEFVEEL